MVASVDSATLASGQFLGADTQNFFSKLAAEQAARKSFFADLTAQSKTLDASGIKQALASRQSTAAAASHKSTSFADMNLAAMTESSLCDQALMLLERLGGLPALSSWAERENLTLSSQPMLHR